MLFAKQQYIFGAEILITSRFRLLEADNFGNLVYYEKISIDFKLLTLFADLRTERLLSRTNPAGSSEMGLEEKSAT